MPVEIDGSGSISGLSAPTEDDQASPKSFVETSVESSDTLAELNDTTISSPADGETLVYNSSTSVFENKPARIKTYADAATRTSSSPTPAEGDLSYLQDTDAVEIYDGSAWVPVAPTPTPPALTNPQYVTKTNEFSMTGNTPTLVTGLEVTITPSSDTAAIMVIAGVNVGNNNGSGQATYQVYANGTAIARYPDPNISGGNNSRYSTQMFTHVPGSTAAQNYEVRVWSPNNVGTVYVNWSSATTVTGGVNVQRSSLFAAEIV